MDHFDGHSMSTLNIAMSSHGDTCRLGLELFYGDH